MSKILSKLMKKGMLMTVILTVILATALVIGGIFGFNKRIDNVNTVTVSMNQYTYLTRLDDVKAECEKAFDDLDMKYEVNGKMDGDESEILYVFGSKADVVKAKEALQKSFDTLTADNGALAGAEISVSAGSENVIGTLAKGYVIRGVIAGLVFAVLAFAYVSLRYKLSVGIFTGVGTLVGMLLTTAVLVLTRVLVTPAVGYVIAASALLTAVVLLLNFNKLRANLKEESAADKSAEELVISSVAVKEIVFLVAALGGAMLLLGIFGNVSIAWFCVSAIIAIAIVTFLGLIYAPVMYLPVKNYADKVAAVKATTYKGAKKTKAKKDETATAEETPVDAE